MFKSREEWGRVQCENGFLLFSRNKAQQGG